jgi:capsular exopolysaccharide synthesis family protein
MAPAVVAYKKKPTEIFESKTSVGADSPQPQPASTVPEVIATVKTVEAVATSSNGDQGPRYSKSAMTTAGHLQKVAGVCESRPVVARTVSTLTTALPPDRTDKTESKNSNVAEALTDNSQRPQEKKLLTPVASSPTADATSKAAQTHAEPLARSQGVGSDQESTEKHLPKELARTTEGPKVPASPVHHREPTAIDIQKLAPPDVVELRPDPQYPCVLDRSMAVGPESFSILRSRLLNVHASQGTKTVIITSAEPEEGKSLITMNLAMSLGLLGKKRILLVDGDLRKRRVTETLHLHQTQGLSDFLEGTTPFSKVVRATSVPMLFVVSAGHIADGVLPEILEGPRWREFLDTAKEQFDLVLIDSVPSGAPLADFELLMAPCDATLMVVRMRKTTREGLVRAMQRIDEKRLLGIVLNNSDHMQRYKYDGYYRHGKITGSGPGRE